MRLQLRITKSNSIFNYKATRGFHFAIIDLDKAPTYPRNFVCMLPMNVGTFTGEHTKFSEIFGKGNIEIVKELLLRALENEDYDVKYEIERRLKLLEYHHVYRKTCISCKKTFQVDLREKSKQRFCEDCLKKKYTYSHSYPAY